jgi:hypothetical protein
MQNNRLCCSEIDIQLLFLKKKFLVATAVRRSTSHPEVDAHSRDEVAGQEETIPESDQETRFANTRVPQ